MLLSRASRVLAVPEQAARCAVVLFCRDPLARYLSCVQSFYPVGLTARRPLRSSVLIFQRSASSSTPVNTVIRFVPQQEAWIVERMGKFHRILEPGLNILVPVIDRIRYVQTLKEIAIEVPKQHAITNDSVPLSLDGVLFVKVVDAYKASYGVEDPEFAITQLAQTTMRSELGKISLDQVFRERESLNANIVHAINNAAAAWGVSCMRYEIRDIHLPTNVQDAMQMQVAAERRKRAAILESEGVRESDINIAEGKKRSQILASEAARQETSNRAEGEAAAIIAVSRARAVGLSTVAEALHETQGPEAAALAVAEQYVAAFSKLAKESNTVVIPSATNDIAATVGQAMAICKNLAAPLKSQRDVQDDGSVTGLSRMVIVALRLMNYEACHKPLLRGLSESYQGEVEPKRRTP